MDESGLSERPTRVRTWAPRGQTPVVQLHLNWKQLSMIADLNLRQCVFRLHEGAIRAVQLVEFLKALRRQLSRRLLAPRAGPHARVPPPSAPYIAQIVRSHPSLLTTRTKKCV
ncbi:MAG: transposase [Betaproteobacteria bacterium]